jgi:hypothetical protein
MKILLIEISLYYNLKITEGVKLKNVFFLIIILSLSFSTYCAETCSRVAIINYQEVLVDSNSSDKGEGLRFHLEKDPIAKQYLDTYQKNSGIFWPNAVLGTVGSGILLYGFFNDGKEDRNVFLITGATAILLNFFVAKTLEITNESNLIKAIDEYNKRNLPKIYFAPEENRSQNDFIQYKVALLKSWSF